MSAPALFRLFTAVLALLSATSTARAASDDPSDAEFTVSEQAAKNSVIGRVDTTAIETGTGQIAFEFIGGNTDETFHIDGRTGDIRVVRPDLLDYETRSRYELTIRVKQASTTDAVQRRFAADLIASNVDPAAVLDLFTATVERRVTVDVLDVNEPPVIPAQSLTLIGDAADSSAAVGRIIGIDPDHGDRLTYEVIAGDPAGLLTIDGSTGRLAISPGSELPAGQQVVPLTVRITDQAGHSDAATVSVRLVGIPLPQVAQAPPAADVVEPAVEPPADPAPPPADHLETPIAATAVAPKTTTAPSRDQAAVEPRQFARPALWFFLAGVLLGAGIMTVVFRYVGRSSVAGANQVSAPRNPFGQPRPQPLVVSTREQWSAIRPSVRSRSEPSPEPPPATRVVIAAADESIAEESAEPFPEPDQRHGAVVSASDGFEAELAKEPVPVANPESTPETVAVPGIPHWREALRFGPPPEPSPVEPDWDDEATTPETDEAPIADVVSDAVPDDHNLPLQPGMSDPAEAWSAPESAEEAPQLLPPVEGGWYSPPEYLVEDMTDLALAQQTATPASDLPQSGAVEEGASLTHDITPPAEPLIHAATWGDAHEARAVPEAWQPQDDPDQSGALQEAVADGNDVYDLARTPEPVNELNETPDLPLHSETWPPTHDLLQGDAAQEIADAVRDAYQAPEPLESASTSDADHQALDPAIGNGEDDSQDAAAVREAAEVLEETDSPLGVEPRVAELRRQLTELFGVRADRPAAAANDEEPAPERGDSIAYHVVKEVASDSARVDGLFESLRFQLDGQCESAGDGDRNSDTDAVIVNPLTPEDELARSAQAEPAARVNKSAVRREISSLREVANTYARAIVARQTTEKRARIVWLVSAGCMVPLFSGGTYLLTTLPPGALRWVGWLLLTGGAAAFSVCLNSFNRLSRLHEDSQVFDDFGSTQSNSPNDTAEFDILGDVSADSSASAAVDAASAPEPDQETPEPEPEEVGTL